MAEESWLAGRHDGLRRGGGGFVSFWEEVIRPVDFHLILKSYRGLETGWYEDLSCLQRIQSYNYYHHRLIILLKSIVVQRNNLLTRVQLLESRLHCDFPASRILLTHIGPKPCLGFEDSNLDEEYFVCMLRE